TAHEKCFLVMEYIDGADLHAWVRKYGPFSVRETVSCARQAALGLAHAHANGVTHRDVKPANLIRRADGVVKVVDLARAKLADRPPDLADLVGRMLAADPNDRPTMAAVAEELYRIAAGLPVTSGSAPTEDLAPPPSEDVPAPRYVPPRPRDYRWWIWGTAAGVI